MLEALVFLQICGTLATLALTVFTLYRMIEVTHEARQARAEARLAVIAVAENVQKIEIATNSMKDALVKATAAASHLEGREEMRGEAAAAAAAAGRGDAPPDTAV